MKQIDQKTKEIIDLKNTEVVRANLTGFAYICTADTFRTFVDTAEYAIEHLDNLFEENELPYEPQSKRGFSRETYKEAVSLLMDNFSKEKYEDVLKIGNVLFEGDIKDTNVKPNNKRRENSTLREEKKQTSSISHLVIGAVAVVAAILVYKFIK